MEPRVFAGIVGAVLTVVGLLLFFLPVSVTVQGVSGTCDSGKAFNGLPSELVLENRAYEEWQDECASGTEARQWWSGGLVGVGLLVVVGSSVVRRKAEAGSARESGAELD